MRIVILLSCTAVTTIGMAQAPPPVDAAHQLDVTPFVAVVDRNGDGCMTIEEWKAAGAPESSHNLLKDAKGCVTAEIMRKTPAPKGLDANRDGKLTLAELKEYDKTLPASPSPPPPPPSSSSPPR